MKLKLEHIANPQVTVALANLMGAELPAAISFKVYKLSEAIKKELTAFEAARKALVEKYAERDEKGELKTNENHYVFSDENQEVFNKEFQELVELDIELTGLKEKDLEKLADSPKPVMIRAADLSALGPLIEANEEKK